MKGIRYHLALSRPFDLEEMERGADRELNPRHVLFRVQQRLGATTHVPDPERSTWIDRALSRIVGQPMHWALARWLAPQLGEGDIVYCAGDDVGIPLAIACRLHGRRPALALWVMEPSKLRFRALVKALGLRSRVDRFVVNTPRKVEQIRRLLELPPARVVELGDQTDTRFFSPGPRSRQGVRPVLFSAGLERRDYRTLAEATRELDVDVRVAAVSPNARASLSAFPEVLPSNMSVGDYPWPQYRQAFRDADLVVLPLLEVDYSPGLTVLLEAMACRRPVVATRTPGVAEQLIDGQYVTGVRPGDAAGLRAAIVGLLGDRQRAETQAERGYRLVQERFDSRLIVEEMVAMIEGLGR